MLGLEYDSILPILDNLVSNVHAENFKNLQKDEVLHTDYLKRIVHFFTKEFINETFLVINKNNAHLTYERLFLKKKTEKNSLVLKY